MRGRRPSTAGQQEYEILATGAAARPAECRCACGSLVARLVSGGVELKCRRCKRTLVLPLQDTADAVPVESGP